jgi:hypothetical protein
MHTVIVISSGLALLALCLLVGRFTTAGGSGMAQSALIFLPLWLLGAAVNMWFGVSRAGYSVADETPTFLIVFGVPAAVAVLLWWKLHA